MPEEIMIIAVVAILAGTFTTVVRSVLAYLKTKSGNKEITKGASMTTSELERLMKEAVWEGNEQFISRFESLEDRMDQLEKERLLLLHQEDLHIPAAGEEEKAPIKRRPIAT